MKDIYLQDFENISQKLQEIATTVCDIEDSTESNTTEKELHFLYRMIKHTIENIDIIQDFIVAYNLDS